MIKASTLKFLSQVAKHNDRDWFQKNKLLYEAAHADVLAFTAGLISELSAIDPAIPPSLEPKACLMRIYRDIRFSNDKTPYKTNFGIGISEQGKSFKGAGYYIHIHPTEPFLAGGCWMPEPDLLKSIRQEIDYNPSEFRAAINGSEFLKYYQGPDREHVLKLLPKGYDADHPEIQFLKLKSFTCTYELEPRELIKAGAVEKVAGVLGALKPFMDFLRSAQ